MVLEKFERKEEKLLPLREFYLRLVKFALLSCVLILFSLGIGIAGYWGFEGLEPVDAFLNSAMLMGGMGPWMCFIPKEERYSRDFMRCTAALC